MIHVPGNWACAQSPCVLVELRGECHLCRLIPVFSAALSYELETSVQVSLAEARRFASQDFAPAETQWVRCSPCPRGLEYQPTSGAASASTGTNNDVGEKMVLRWPLFHYVVKEIVVDGPRCAARATASHLAASLMGRYVLPGAKFQTENGVYTVRQMALQTGYCGVALVGADCRVRVNDVRSEVYRSGETVVLSPMGLDKEVRQLTQFMEWADKSVGSHVGVIVRGPRQCGISTALRFVLANPPAAHESVHWSPHFSAIKAVRDGWGGTVILLVWSAEHYFAEAEPELAKLHLRKLEKDIAELRYGDGGVLRSVVVFCVSHDYGLCAADVLASCFFFHVTFSYPTASQRAHLLACVRGGDAVDWLSAAQALVGRTRAQTLEAARQPTITAHLPFRAVSWSEIGGLAKVKERLRRALVWPQQQPELMQRFRIVPPRGILLYGPPGCAKTTLIKALCSEGMFSLIYLDSATVVSAYVGESERYLRDVFERARRQAPCIVFFDEVEVLGGRRAAGGHDTEHVRLLSTLLTEMDGFADTQGVCFVGATNVPHLLDAALMRPGRFDHLVHVPLPALDDRKSILRLLLHKTAADADAIAELTEGFSGADLKVFCSESLLDLLRESEDIPPIFSDGELLTMYLLQRAKSFQRTPYDSAALERFEKEHQTA